MLNESIVDKVYLACGNTDMRKSIDGLAAIVSMTFSLDPFSSCLFVFCNKQKDKLKILRWDLNGFWLFYRRLERGKFDWPSTKTAKTQLISRRQLNWLLDGLSIEQWQAHSEMKARKIV